MSTISNLVAYYQNLLILQYNNKPKALATISTQVKPVLIPQDDGESLPLAVQNGFNLMGDNVAIGKQLDILGKYVGVTRSGHGFTTSITLDDENFLSLIKMAISINSSGSSLYDIQNILFQFFPGQILVFDYQNMHMSYLIDEDVGSQELIQMFIVQNLLPKPMGVQIALVIYAPDIDNFFGFRTYELPGFNVSPFNSYDDYQMDAPWLSYSDAISI